MELPIHRVCSLYSDSAGQTGAGQWGEGRPLRCGHWKQGLSLGGRWELGLSHLSKLSVRLCSVIDLIASLPECT